MKFLGIQAEAMGGQLGVMKSQLTELQRGQQSVVYVTFPVGDMKLENIKQLSFTNYLRNYGKSIAKQIFIFSKVELVNSDSGGPSFNYSGIIPSLQVGMLPPDSPPFPLVSQMMRPNRSIAQITISKGGAWLMDILTLPIMGL